MREPFYCRRCCLFLGYLLCALFVTIILFGDRLDRHSTKLHSKHLRRAYASSLLHGLHNEMRLQVDEETIKFWENA
ncbi:unnamed protein product [Trifolium pratense]|uniref:Uncharacterized protein n=1 Tax=Trifolium pratense TaxID=57577 RepID=A0ACB0JJY2_TRIPR|nr:unnamed protein product [Trifolium pratense]